MLKIRQKKAQSTLEYIVVLTAIISLIIYAAVTWIGPAVQKSINSANSTMTGSSTKVADLLK